MNLQFSDYTLCIMWFQHRCAGWLFCRNCWVKARCAFQTSSSWLRSLVDENIWRPCKVQIYWFCKKEDHLLYQSIREDGVVKARWKVAGAHWVAEIARVIARDFSPVLPMREKHEDLIKPKNQQSTQSLECQKARKNYIEITVIPKYGIIKMIKIVINDKLI